MNNPYPKQPSGSYKEPLVKALKQSGEEYLSTAFQSGELKLAIAATITGAVEIQREITIKCAEALHTLEGNLVADFYRWGLQHGQFVVASTKGAFVYDPDNTVTTEYVQQKLREQIGEVKYFR